MLLRNKQYACRIKTITFQKMMLFIPNCNLRHPSLPDSVQRIFIDGIEIPLCSLPAWSVPLILIGDQGSLLVLVNAIIVHVDVLAYQGGDKGYDKDLVQRHADSVFLFDNCLHLYEIFSSAHKPLEARGKEFRRRGSRWLTRATAW